MFDIKKIVFPTDFSKHSYKALNIAKNLALSSSAELILIHVVAPLPVVTPTMAPGATPTVFNVASYQKELEASAKRSLEAVTKKENLDKLRTMLVVRQGQAADEIVNIAEEEEADLIVIATHGETGWRRFVFGSVTEKVVRNATCPVLTIPIVGEEED